jgi:hypothetical protein
VLRFLKNIPTAMVTAKKTARSETFVNINGTFLCENNFMESLIKCSSSEMERICSPSKRLSRKWPQA